jgi:RimJ/RimL family protein N-acetyltransferase
MLSRVALVPPNPPLSDGVVTLRPPAPEDAGWVTDACQDEDIQRFNTRIPRPYVVDDARAWISQSALDWRDGRDAAFVVVSVRDGEGLGAIGLSLAGDGLAETGYWVKPEARGRGVATAALRLVAGWAFQELGVERLQLTTHPDNAASQRVAAKAGFSREGTLRAWLVTRDGRRDAVMFSLLPGDPATRT